MKKCIALFFLALPSWAQIHFVEKPAEDKVEVYVGDQLFTALLFDSDTTIKKPVLYPILSPGNHFITRGWPKDPRPGERTDHPHHVGMWLNMGDVNGNDFWNNSYERDHSKNRYGTIVFTGLKKKKEGKKGGELVLTADWLDHAGVKLLEEETTYFFSASDQARIIDRTTILKAVENVLIADNKEGLFAIRLAKELEHPDPKMDYTPTGEYTNDLGVKGTDVWGKRSEWMRLTGNLDGEEVTVAMFDHPDNPNFPGHWHARGYGLYAINNVGSDVFTKGAEISDLSLPAGAKTTFRYRVIIASRHLTEDEMIELAQDFQD